MFPGCYNADGRLRIKYAAVLDPSYNHGIPCGPDFVFAINAPAAVYTGGLPVVMASNLAIASAAITGYQNGMPFEANGALASNPAAAAFFQNGLPFAADGRLAVEVVI